MIMNSRNFAGYVAISAIIVFVSFAGCGEETLTTPTENTVVLNDTLPPAAINSPLSR
jgi:hypothetical protein